MSGTTFTPGPSPNTVRAADGRVLTAPEGWSLLPPCDAALTRRAKAASSPGAFGHRQRPSTAFFFGRVVNCPLDDRLAGPEASSARLVVASDFADCSSAPAATAASIGLSQRAACLSGPIFCYSTGNGTRPVVAGQAQGGASGREPCSQP